MQIDPKLVKALREKTGAGMMDCKQALQEAGGDIAEAEKILRKKGIAVAGKKALRAAKEGCIASYIHHGSKLGVLLEVNCETDFVARNEGFRELVKDITQHIAAANPSYVRREDVPAAVVEGEKEIYRAQVKDKPAPAIEKIVAGKLEKFYSQVCLLEQPREHRGSPLHSLAARRGNPGLDTGRVIHSAVATPLCRRERERGYISGAAGLSILSRFSTRRATHCRGRLLVIACDGRDASTPLSAGSARLQMIAAPSNHHHSCQGRPLSVKPSACRRPRPRLRNTSA